MFWVGSYTSRGREDALSGIKKFIPNARFVESADCGKANHGGLVLGGAKVRFYHRSVDEVTRHRSDNLSKGQRGVQILKKKKKNTHTLRHLIYLKPELNRKLHHQSDA